MIRLNRLGKLRGLPVAFLACLLPLPSAAQLSASDEPGDEPGIEFFERKIRPVLAQHCYRCHGPKKQESGLRLDRVDDLKSGGSRGEAIVAGEPDQSLLIHALQYREEEEVQMPPDGKLPDAVIADFARWIEQGAPVPPPRRPKSAEPVTTRTPPKLWCLTPVKPVTIPEVGDKNWPLQDLDHFILAKLESAKIAPATTAPKRTIIRRLYFDLIGLPPTPGEVQRFVDNPNPNAVEQLATELLDSPHFGERWGRHWLDLVRYAETRGHEFDYPIANAYQYRDYVIRAFNSDVPYNELIIEHIAGDLVNQPRLHEDKGFNESQLGTGFWFLGEEVHSPVEIRKDETDRTDNKIDVLSKTFLGLTLACARCHDHKFDPITANDYYAMAGFILSSSYSQARFESAAHNRTIARKLDELRQTDLPVAAKATVDSIRAGIGQTAAYLQACYRVIHGNQSAEEIAEDGSLDSARLTNWLAQVEQAAHDQSHPLHCWAAMCSGEPVKAPPTEQPNRLRVILDYAGDASLLCNGFLFGKRARRTGQLIFDPDEGLRVVEQNAAVADPFWDGLKTAPGTERDPGKVNWNQAGRTVRTPTVTMKSGRLWYLVRGSGIAYAAVSSHRLLNGPLHGTLIRSWEGPDQLHWVEHNLTRYPGHRVHIEFTPRDGKLNKGSRKFALLKVVESDSRPPLPTLENPVTQRLNSQVPNPSVTDLAESVQQLLNDSATKLALGQIESEPDATGLAKLCNWMLSGRGLFGETTDEAAGAIGQFQQRREALRNQIQLSSKTAPVMMEGNGVDERVLLRGDPATPAELARRRLIESVGGPDQKTISSGSGRLSLALRIADPTNPLTARVIVNRVWHHLMGRGIVGTVDNFGHLGQTPSHPELLDFLARQFVDDGWSIKRLIKRIVLSRTYRMSTQGSQTAQQHDPTNRLWHKREVKRLQAEAIRDSVLACSGRLDRTLFGPSVEVHLNPFMEGRGRPKSGPLDGGGRRSIYIKVRRNFLDPMFLAFDFPIPFSTIGRRTISNVPAQALTLMNSPFVARQMKLWGERVASNPALESDRARIDYLYRTAFARPPSASEHDQAIRFVREQRTQYERENREKAVWADLCHVLVNVKEFIFIQ